MPLEPRKAKPPAKRPAYKGDRIRVSSRALAFARGELTIEDLDDEEIARGQFRNAAGDFRGRPANLIPREFASELMRQHQERIFRELAVDVVDAMKTLRDVMKTGGRGPGANAQVKAAEIILQYNIGKVPDKIEIKGEIETWEHRAEAAVVDWGELKQLQAPGYTKLGKIIPKDDEETDE